MQAAIALLLNQLADGFILNFTQMAGINIAFRQLQARLLNSVRTSKTAENISPERGLVTLHVVSLTAGR